jgi:hypothetical protein
MADDTKIRGTVKIASDDHTARVAYQMALDLWNASNGNLPTVDDDDFLKLVARCARALNGVG